MQFCTTELGTDREHFQKLSLIFAGREAAWGINGKKQILYKFILHRVLQTNCALIVFYLESIQVMTVIPRQSRMTKK